MEVKETTSQWMSKLAKWQVGKKAHWQKKQFVKMASWWKSKLTKMQVDKMVWMARWWNGKLMKKQVDKIASRWNDKLKK
jgi:hypothetical protein